MVLAADLLLKLVDLRRKELYRAATLGADHVVVTSAIVLVFEASDTVMKGNFAGQPAFCKQFQRSVYRGETNLRIPFPHKLIQLVGGKMLPRLQEGEQNGVTLLGVLESDLFQMAMKDVLCLAQRLAGNRRMIVNTFLQHSNRRGVFASTLTVKTPEKQGELYRSSGCDFCS